MAMRSQIIRGTLHFSFLVFILAMQGCLLGSKNSNNAPASSSDTNGNSSNAASWAACNDDLDADAVNPNAVVTIPYYINSYMLDHATGNLVCTPRAIREKIKKVFDLYASIPEAGLQFRYAGPDDTNYSLNPASIQSPAADGALHVILTDNTASTTYSGIALTNWYWGKAGSGYNNPTATNYIPYPGGSASLVLHSSDGYDQATNISFGLLMHEIGHALSLDHIPAKGANMSRYSGGFSAGERYTFTEAERAAIAGIIPAAGTTIYRISGSVNTTAKSYCNNSTVNFTVGGPVDVLAVDITNGRTYAGLAHCAGTATNPKFWINIQHPGSYRLVTIPDGVNSSVFDTTAYQASWYIDNSNSTNDPTAGTVITLNDSTPTASNVVINMIASPAAYAFNASSVQADSSQPTFDPSQLSPGSSGVLDFFNICGVAGGNNPGTAHCDPVTAIEPYGTSPDYSFSNLTVTNDLGASGAFYSVRVTANANAAPGHRIAIGRASNGVVQVAILGVHILRSSAVPPRIDQVYSIQQQFLGYFDFTSLNALWWR